MKRHERSYLLIIILVICIFISACKQSDTPEASPPEVNLETLEDVRELSLGSSDSDRIKLDFFGYDLSLYGNTLKVSVTNETVSVINSKLEDALIDLGWRLESDDDFPIWRKDNLLLAIRFVPVNVETMNSMRRMYGIKDLEIGQTLMMTYRFDKSRPLPNPTETAESLALIATKTQAPIEATKNYIAHEATAEAVSARETEMVFNEQAIATQQAIDAQATATQTALNIEVEKQNALATSQAIQSQLDQMGTEFEDENSIPDGMTIVREDPTRWDLTSSPGWLHIKGRYSYFRDDNWIPKNIFLLPLRSTNIRIITRVDASMDSRGQSVYMGLTPNDYHSDGYTIEIGISIGFDGRYVYAWACRRETCYYSDDEFEDLTKFNGPVYLRLDIQGNTYTIYYGEDESNWIYLGEVKEFAAGDKLFLGASGGQRDSEFDGYFDFLRFEAIPKE